MVFSRLGLIVLLLDIQVLLLFWYTQSDIGHRAVKTRLSQLTGQTRKIIPQSEQAADCLAKENPGAAVLARYIRRSGCYPVFERTAAACFPIGEEKRHGMQNARACGSLCLYALQLPRPPEDPCHRRPYRF